MDCPFVVGQKVVYIDDRYNDVALSTGGIVDYKSFMINTHGVIFPEIGKTYTIREITTSRLEGSDHPTLLLVEIVNPLVRYLGYPTPAEQQFRCSRFRPLIKKKTDISVFKAMLNKSPSQNLDELVKSKSADRKKKVVEKANG